MIWLLYLLVIVASVTIVIYAKSRGRQEIRSTTYDTPLKVDRSDFAQLDQETLVVAFLSQKCDSCIDVWSKAQVLGSNKVGVTKIDFEDPNGKKLHKKYEIEAVPTVIICDSSGVTQKAFLGAVTATDLWAAVARVRGENIAQCGDH